MSRPNDSSRSSDGEVLTAASLQPMGFTDILDSMFSLYRKHFRLFASICSVYFVIALAANLLSGISALLFSSVDHLSISSGVGGAISVATFLVTNLAMLVVTGTLFFGVTQVFLGERITAWAAFMHTKRRFWSLFFSGLLYGIVIIALVSIYMLVSLLYLFDIFLPVNAGLVISGIGILAAIYVGVRWVFCGLAAVFEEKSVLRALKRSSELVKGGWWRVFGKMIGIFLIVIFFQSVLPFSWGLISGVTDGTQVDENLPQQGSQEDANLLEELMGMFRWT